VSFVFHPGATDVALITMSLAAARELVAATRTVDVSPSSRVVRPFPRDVASFATNIATLRRTAECQPHAVDGGLGHRVEVLVRQGLRRCLNRTEAAEVVKERPGSRSSIVRRVEEFFREHVDETVSMTRLSTFAGVSERSLRNAFYRVCATSPKKYLRISQLHQVRRSLRSAPRGPSAITNVATQHGFYELGRFAGEYRALFGEAPSQTLHKARSRPTVLASRWPVVAAS
jgi:transcriptional regulator GlxA family with amidase domain